MEQRWVVARNVADMLAEPCDGAERVSQALYGEEVRVLDSHDAFGRVETPDGYEGWVAADALAPLHGRAGSALSRRIVASLIEPVYESSDPNSRQITLLTVGATVLLDGCPEHEGGRISLIAPDGRPVWIRRAALGPVPAASRTVDAMAVRRIALTFVGVPYLWGGRTPFGMDCSGFTQRVHALCGIALPRDACQQAAFPGSRLLGEEPTRAGDLLFFAGDRDPRGRGITHVGMVLDHPLFIHASGSAGVAVSSLEEGPYRRQLRSTTRLKSEGE